MKTKQQKRQNFLKNCTIFLGLLALGIASRTIWHFGANVEFVTALAVVSPLFFRSYRWSLLLTLVIMVGSDLILGNTNIFLFTWSAFLLAPVLARLVQKLPFKSVYGKQMTAGLLSNLVFFFWTNFGVVVLTTMYSKNWQGLTESYFFGLPFLRNQILSTMIGISALMGLFYAVKFVKSLLRKQQAIPAKVQLN